MKVHIVHAHPEPGSFTAAMRDVIASTFTAQGDEVTISDLYAMGFNPLVSAADFAERRDPDHLVIALEQRHGYQNGTIAPDIAAEIEKLLAADLIAFTFPLFWFSVPAMLKGWIDRVLISGPFYGGKRLYGKGGLAGKRAFAAFGLGGRAAMFGSDAIHGDLETGMMRHFLQGTLGYVGLTVLQPFVAHHLPYLDADGRQALLDDLAGTIRAIDSRPAITMPDLGRFDDRLEPLQGN